MSASAARSLVTFSMGNERASGADDVWIPDQRSALPHLSGRTGEWVEAAGIQENRGVWVALYKSADDDRSSHSGLLRSMRSIFQLRRHFFSCFSRRIASSIRSNRSA